MLEWLWDEALQMQIIFLNRVPRKSAHKTPFQLLNNRKPTIGHCHIWSCPTKVWIYNPKLKVINLEL